MKDFESLGDWPLKPRANYEYPKWSRLLFAIYFL